MLIAANYHYVRPRFDEPFPGIFGITTEAFRKQLELLGRAGEFVSADAVLAAVRGSRPLPERAILITFDDGLREHFEWAWSVMRSMGVPGLFFVNTAPIENAVVATVHKIHLLRASMAPEALLAMVEESAAQLGLRLDHVFNEANMRAQYPFDSDAGARLKYLLNFTLRLEDRAKLVDSCFRTHFGKAEPEISRKLYLTREQIREMGAAGAIGSHSHDHLPLGLLSAQEQTASMGRSKELLTAWMGHAPAAISYPYGTREAVTPEVAARAAAHGFEFGFTVEMAGNDGTTLATSPLLLARYDCNHMPGGKAQLWSEAELFTSAPLSTWHQGAGLQSNAA